MKKLLVFSGLDENLFQSLQSLDLGIEMDNIDINKNISFTNSYDIKKIPTLILLKDGVEIGRKAGSLVLENIQQFILTE